MLSNLCIRGYMRLFSDILGEIHPLLYVLSLKMACVFKLLGFPSLHFCQKSGGAMQKASLLKNPTLAGGESQPRCSWQVQSLACSLSLSLNVEKQTVEFANKTCFGKEWRKCWADENELWSCKLPVKNRSCQNAEVTFAFSFMLLSFLYLGRAVWAV